MAMNINVEGPTGRCAGPARVRSRAREAGHDYSEVLVDGLLTTQDVARLLGCSPAAVRRWRAQGRLRAVKLGRLVRYRGEDVQRVASRGL